MTLITDIEAKKAIYQQNFAAPPSYLLLDQEKYALLLFELNNSVNSKKPINSIKEFLGMQVVLVNHFCEGRLRWGFGK